MIIVKHKLNFGIIVVYCFFSIPYECNLYTSGRICVKNIVWGPIALLDPIIGYFKDDLYLNSINYINSVYFEDDVSIFKGFYIYIHIRE